MRRRRRGNNGHLFFLRRKARNRRRVNRCTPNFSLSNSQQAILIEAKRCRKVMRPRDRRTTYWHRRNSTPNMQYTSNRFFRPTNRRGRRSLSNSNNGTMRHTTSTRRRNLLVHNGTWRMRTINNSVINNEARNCRPRCHRYNLRRVTNKSNRNGTNRSNARRRLNDSGPPPLNTRRISGQTPRELSSPKRIRPTNMRNRLHIQSTRSFMRRRQWGRRDCMKGSFNGMRQECPMPKETYTRDHSFLMWLASFDSLMMVRRGLIMKVSFFTRRNDASLARSRAISPSNANRFRPFKRSIRFQSLISRGYQTRRIDE